MAVIISQNLYFVNTHIEYINKLILPNKNEYFPIFLFNALPRIKPVKVNIKLIIENKGTDKIILSYIYFKPNPIEKLSKLTENENIIIPNKLSVFNSLLSSKKSKNILIDINKNIKNTIYLGLNNVCSNKEIPTKLPKRGIKKWNIPTLIAVKIICFLLNFFIPYEIASANASILKLIAINIIFMIINHLPILYYYNNTKNIF